MNSKRQQTQAAFRKLKPAIDQTYPQGWFVALEGDQIIADAPSFEKLTEVLVGLGKKPAETFMVQAGVEYPQTAIIL
jgi:hypothetical protein